MEGAGSAILQRAPVMDVGERLFECGTNLELLAKSVKGLAPDMKEANESCQRMLFAAERMRDAGDKLRGTESEKKPKGKAWIKG